MNRCSTYTELQMETTMRYYLLNGQNVLNWQSAGEDMKLLEILVLVGMQNGKATLKSSLVVLLKKKKEATRILTIQLSTPTPRY